MQTIQYIAAVEELRRHIKIAYSFPIENILPFVDRCDHCIRYFVGNDLLCQLFKNTPTPLSVAVQAVIAPLAMALYVHEGSLNTTDSGFSVTRTTDLAPASDDKINRLRISLFETAHDNLEKLLATLALQQEWDSPYRRVKHTIMPTVDCYTIPEATLNDRQLYFDALHRNAQAIFDELKPIIPPERVEETLNDSNGDKTLTQHIRRYIACRSALEADGRPTQMPYRSVGFIKSPLLTPPTLQGYRDKIISEVSASSTGYNNEGKRIYSFL